MLPPAQALFYLQFVAPLVLLVLVFAVVGVAKALGWFDFDPEAARARAIDASR